MAGFIDCRHSGRTGGYKTGELRDQLVIREIADLATVDPEFIPVLAIVMDDRPLRRFLNGIMSIEDCHRATVRHHIIVDGVTCRKRRCVHQSVSGGSDEFSRRKQLPQVFTIRGTYLRHDRSIS